MKVGDRVIVKVGYMKPRFKYGYISGFSLYAREIQVKLDGGGAWFYKDDNVFKVQSGTWRELARLNGYTEEQIEEVV
jgi:hypothetical protein